MRVPQAEWQERHAPRETQIEGFDVARLHKDSVEAKLFPAWTGARARSFAKCGREKLYRECRECGATETYDYHCNLKWCPCCNWRVTHLRAKELRYLTAGLRNLKHCVLTQRNFEHLTRDKIKKTRDNLAKLRRSKLFKPVVGGCCSLEFTNEGNGWHMHWHMLLESGFIDEQLLAVQWGKYVGQEFAIVRCRAVGDNDYIREVSKYVVEGSEIARWPRETVLEFVNALDSTRLFSVYGAWKDRRAAARAAMNADRPMPTCDCGSIHFIYGDDESFVKADLRRQGIW